MFLPKTESAVAEEKKAQEERKLAYQRIEKWVLEAIVEHLREGLQVEVQEVQCGDPTCSPIDTAIITHYPSGKSGMFGVPAEATNVKKDDVLQQLPPNDIFAAWKNGEDADWPPEGEEEILDRPQLRFQVGQKVECKIAPDPVTGWASGVIIQLWYREANWPPNSWAPYKIQLDDGRNIFAPGDIDQIIRAVPSS